jgi:hypothetical protein
MLENNIKNSVKETELDIVEQAHLIQVMETSRDLVKVVMDFPV